VLEARGREEVKPIRDALSQLQVAYTRLAGEAGAPPAGNAPAGGQQPPEKQPGTESGPGPAQGSGRLWVPGR
jgi:hypothetical protein